MKKLNLNKIRSAYLDFFKNKGHLVLKSYSLIPENDDSLLLINAGMAPLKDYFTGTKKMAKNRATSSQKCIRTADIDRVGKTHRHGTFFEMLGNFSFGDYFKKEAISWAWEFLTEKMELEKEKLWVSIYEEDDEAHDIWKNDIKIPEDRIIRLGKEDNFWELEVGPCGPCSEIYYDRGEKYGCGMEDCKPGCDCDRFLEIWNLVFTQFNKMEDGRYEKLQNPNIDTGMGLERITLVMEDVGNIFEISIIKDIISEIENISGVKYNESAKSDISIRVIADHIRAVTFMVSDGVVPSNEGRGYVLRRLLRRAARHGKLLGIQGNFLKDLSLIVMNSYFSEYPELIQDKKRIFNIIEREENKFQETLDSGLGKLTEYIEEMKKNGVTVLSGDNAFKLYDTYGFPPDLSKEILEEYNMTMDDEGFNESMKAQKVRSRSARAENVSGWTEHDELLDDLPETLFEGYKLSKCESSVIKLYKDNKEVEFLEKGDKGILILNKTVFYGEGGGQIGDKGKIFNKSGTGIVYDTKKNKNNCIIHLVDLFEGKLNVGDIVTSEINENRRESIKKNHSATHLLDEVLKRILGNHVKQAGSYVGDDRLRFDFTHFEAVSKDDLKKIEKMVNTEIAKGLSVSAEEMSLEESQKEGAIGLFEDKYKDIVRVVKMGDFSCELCGGTHVSNTNEIQIFKILSESGISAGIRRIEAITGIAVYDYLNNMEDVIDRISQNLKTDRSHIEDRVSQLLINIKEKDKQILELKNFSNTEILDDLLKNKKDISGINVVTGKIENTDVDSLRDIGDKVRDKLKSAIIVLAGINEDKLTFVAMVSKDLTDRYNAGKIVKSVAQMTGGNGGGRADSATAGGKNVEKVDEALDLVSTLV